MIVALKRTTNLNLIIKKVTLFTITIPKWIINNLRDLYIIAIIYNIRGLLLDNILKNTIISIFYFYHHLFLH